MLSVNPPACQNDRVGGTSIDDVDRRVDAWLASLRSDNTRAAYRRDMVVFRQWLHASRLSPRKVTVGHVERFAEHCADGGESDATVRRRMAAVTSFYRHVGGSWSMPNPATDADRPVAGPEAPAPVLTPAQAAAVWKAATDLGSKAASVVGLVLLDGLKSHELLRLDAADLRRTAGGGFSVAVPGRAESSPVTLDGRTVAALRRYLAGRRTGPLLYGDNPTREQARLTRYGVDYLVRRTAEQSGVTASVTVNVLRNTQSAARRAAPSDDA